MVWLKDGDYKMLEKFTEGVDELLQKLGDNVSPQLYNKLRGTIPEIYAVITLHKKFEAWKISWKGGHTPRIDITLQAPGNNDYEIQVKKITNIDTRGRGENKVLLSYYWQVRERKDISCPWIFIYNDEKNKKPTFFCVPEADMKRLMDIATEERQFLEEKWRPYKGKEKGNPMLRINFYSDVAKTYFNSKEDLEWSELYKKELGHEQAFPLASAYIDNWNTLFVRV